jgi:uridine monophosphate synthetase
MTKKIIEQLFHIGAIRFGHFTLKSGIISPIYIDLRLTISQPKLLSDIAKELYALAKNLSFDLLCGVPYTALPFATAISLQQNIPMILKRKEKKDYGTKRMVEGIFQPGERCLIIEDVITSGTSIAETAASLKEEGLLVTDALVLVNREQGGERFLASQGIKVHAVCNISSIIQHLLEQTLLDEKTFEAVLTFIKDNQTYV